MLTGAMVCCLVITCADMVNPFGLGAIARVHAAVLVAVQECVHDREAAGRDGDGTIT